MGGCTNSSCSMDNLACMADDPCRVCRQNIRTQVSWTEHEGMCLCRHKVTRDRVMTSTSCCHKPCKSPLLKHGNKPALPMQTSQRISSQMQLCV